MILNNNTAVLCLYIHCHNNTVCRILYIILCTFGVREKKIQPTKVAHIINSPDCITGWWWYIDGYNSFQFLDLHCQFQWNTRCFLCSTTYQTIAGNFPCDSCHNFLEFCCSCFSLVMWLDTSSRLRRLLYNIILFR